MDESKIAEARRLLLQVAHELDSAATAARGAAGSTDRERSWSEVQQLYTRFASAEQLLKDVRRTVDAAIGET